MNLSFVRRYFTHNGLDWFECKFATAGERRVIARHLRRMCFAYERHGNALWVQVEDFHIAAIRGQS